VIVPITIEINPTTAEIVLITTEIAPESIEIGVIFLKVF